MASAAQSAANRLNSRKSTGPSTPAGRARSSMNALKHENRSQKLALLREESYAFEDRQATWRIRSANLIGKPSASVGPICSAPGKKSSGDRCYSAWSISTPSAIARNSNCTRRTRTPRPSEQSAASASIPAPKFGSGDRHDDRSEHADLIDADSVQQHRDDMIAIGEIDENVTSEANFDETTRIM